MGAHSTLNITRQAALEYALRNLLTASDSQLEDVMAHLLDDRLYNVRIVGEDQENDNARL